MKIERPRIFSHMSPACFNEIEWMGKKENYQREHNTTQDTSSLSLSSLSEQRRKKGLTIKMKK